MKNNSIQWWVIGLCPLEYEAHRGVFLARAWAQNDEVRYVHPMELTTLVRTKYDKKNFQRPSDYGQWTQKNKNLFHISLIGFYIPSFSRIWRMPGSWWAHKWPFGSWLMPGIWWMSEWFFGRWLRCEMTRLKQPGVQQIIINFCWKLSWSLRSAPAALLVYDCCDIFKALARETPERTDWAERRLASLSDAIVISSLNFASHFKFHNSPVIHIPNGVSQELLDRLAPLEVGKAIRGTGKPVIIYHGITDAWRFNWDLYLSAAQLCPEYEFRIYGKTYHVPAHLNIPANVRLLEWIQPHELCSVLNQCSLGFMPYELTEPTLSGFPLKMFEYFAAGLPVVSTRLREVERFADQVILCDNDPQSTAALICHAITNDTAELRNTRRLLAEKYSWSLLSRQYRECVLSQFSSKVKTEACC